MAHLLNPLATASQLYHKSSFSSLPQDLQETIFITSQCLTQAAGQLLELPQSVTAQANVILARYWLVDSPMANEFSVSSRPVKPLYKCLAILTRASRTHLLLLFIWLPRWDLNPGHHATYLMFMLTSYPRTHLSCTFKAVQRMIPGPITCLKPTITPFKLASLPLKPEFSTRFHSTHTSHCLIHLQSLTYRHWTFSRSPSLSYLCAQFNI